MDDYGNDDYGGFGGGSDYLDYSDEDGYGTGELSGLSIHGSLEEMDSGMTRAEQELANMMMGAGSTGDSDVYIDRSGEGMASISTLQLGRIGHVEPRIQAGIKAILSGQSIDGIHPVDAAAAREEFASIIGGDPSKFASQIKLDEAVQLPRHEQDLRTVVSMLQNTAGSYLERGPGGQLVNNIADVEKQMEADAELREATGIVKDLAGLYLDPRTIGSPVESARRRALEESITKRLIDGTFYDGSKNLLPLPNETGVTGIVATQGIYGSPQGTAEDRLSASKFDEKYVTFKEGQKTKFVRDDSGYKVFRDDVPQSERNEILRRTPNLQNSLFPAERLSGQKTYSVAELEAKKRGRAYQMSLAQGQAEKARRILRKQMPTTRDESKNQIRMSGWDTPMGEQADLQNLRNEAAILDIDWNSKFAGQGEDEVQSALTEYIENATELEPNITGGEIKQGTQAWLNQRKGKITASTAAGLLKEGGVEERAMELAMERLGTAIPFHGNAHTREGTEGEAKAASAFMAQQGRGMTLVEAYFEENEAYKGFGVSPDGRLYNDEGESEGLLELKYLSSGSMAGALSKYTPQMQMQMAITGESQTHFYALDKYTGEYVHEVVQANSDMQSQLLEAGQQALQLGAGLDNRGVQALRKQIESNKPRQRKGASEKVVGQTEAFATSETADEPMTAFNPRAAAVANLTSSSGGAASETKLAQKLEQLDQAERMKAAVADASGDATDVQAMGKLEGQAYAEDARRTQKASDAIRTAGLTELSAYAEDEKRTADAKAEADKANAEATKEASESVKNFGASVKQAANVLGELGGLITGGNASGMSEVRLAAETGQTTAQVRGTREALEFGGLDTAGANRTIMGASGLVKTFNDEQQAAARFTTLMEDRGRSNLEAVRTMDVPSIQELQGMNPAQMASMVASLMQGKSPEARAQIGKMFGMTELSTYNQDPASLNNIDGTIQEGALRDTYSGITTVEQGLREARETAGSLGETTGMLGSGTQAVAAVAGSATAGYLASKAAPFLTKAAQTGPKAASMIKNLSTAARATPLALAASVAPMAVRHVGDIKDDGGVGDSLMDVAEFATYGAAIGSVVPGVGTAVGAGVGAAIGVANEAWDYFSADDAMPDTNIGNMPTQTKQANQASKQTVNVEVTNEISPDLIRTTTDVDGDLNIDEEAGLSTGGW